MDASDIMSIVLRGALGRSGRKRARRARNFLSGHAGFLTASTIMAAAGVAWGIYDSLAKQVQQVQQVPQVPRVPRVPRVPQVPQGQPVPPVPVPADDAALPFELLRLVRLAVSAARADGTLSADERALILTRAREAGLESVVETELAAVRPLADLVAGVTAATQREELYVLAFTIIRADETVTGAERIYLAQLAHQLGLDPATAARLEEETARKIDEAPDS